MTLTMAHDADFCGDRLRLAAFLRAVENLPQRPARFRRPVDGDAQIQATKQASPAQHDQTRAIASLSSPASTAPQQKLSAFDAADSRLTASTASAEGTRTIALPVTPDADCHAQPSVNIDEDDSTVPHRRSDPLLLLRKGSRKSVKVSHSRRRAANLNAGLSGTRKRRRLPVKGLALVRTTTEDGLPQPSV
ncbi:hypothetical protein BU26DRAFT_303069 [Trematosphaeria pertusa]|uniref:Uncharacterized protein n=1 Tax=Trematosphaeria pertusa TaxID=390896 RepID=A0A6A6IDI7_9PLEO|nr:uncharacterized protein BU26DRAFT_303069 [Trematosphaeria pertusa]KAF2248635.1 hypothetical protein BU26DRAFT_303069 [Trematosphaeria pertusa]